MLLKNLSDQYMKKKMSNSIKDSFNVRQIYLMKKNMTLLFFVTI